MRIVVLSTLYPPVVRGGYEVECSAVVEHLRRCGHEVAVLTGTAERAETAPQRGVARVIPALPQDARGSLLAPPAALRAAEVGRRALALRPDLVYSWNGADVAQTTLRVIADAGAPIAVRVCEHWFGRLFTHDQYMRELLPARRGAARRVWSLGVRGFNRLPSLRLDPLSPFPAAISWNSAAIKRMAGTPPMVEPVLERIGHSVPRNGERMAAVVRRPAPQPEIAYLGRVTPYKGIATAVEAIALLHSRHGIPARLVVAGWEEDGTGAEMRRLAASRGVADAIDWAGPLDADGVAELLGRTHALIVPSEWDEPFPLVTIEGAFARVPLVASDVGGIGEGMHDEEHALLFGRGDADAAAAALARTLSEQRETAARVERARERAERFRLEPYLEAQEQFVQDAVAALRAAGR